MNHYTPLSSRIIISIAKAVSIYRRTVLLGLFGFVMMIAGLTGLLFYPSSFSKALGRLGVTVEAKSGWRTSNQMWSRMVTTSLRRLGLDPSAARLATSPAPFATLKVGPGETYATIQSAINAAATGDTIEVAPGTYTENLTINGKNLIILGPNRNL
ncbi:MAG: hypothetical protein ACK5RR_13295, partial [Acidobacteriota bacterium]